MAVTAGVLYLVIILCAGFSEGFVRSRIVVPGDAVQTALNITSSETLFRVAFATDLVAFTCDVVLAVVLYLLFRPLNATLSLIAGALRLTQAAVLGANLLDHMRAILLLNDPAYASALGLPQVQALALFSLDAHAYGYNLSGVFFGAHNAVLSYLFFTTRTLPMVLGILLGSAAIAYLSEGFVSFLVPQHANVVTVSIVPVVVVAEISFCLWLLLARTPRRLAASS
jgi:hypothetical protein